VIRAQGTVGPPEVGIVAARRVGSAVQRNRAKRRIRAALESVDLQCDTAYIVVASPDVVSMAFDELVRRVRAATAAPRVAEET
jgi:ribonuclease P protein component